MGHYSVDDLHIHFQDFAYQHKGRLRMESTNIGDTTAKTFAE